MQAGVGCRDAGPRSGWRKLAQAIIERAYKDKDDAFFKSNWFDVLSLLAYGDVSTYTEPVSIRSAGGRIDD